MPPKTKTSIAKTIAYIGIPLAILQAGYIALFNMSAPSSPRDSINEALEKVQGIDERRRSMMRIQLSITDYASRHGNEVPASLNELIPEYFDTLPIDPATRKPFSYRVDGTKFNVGYDVTTPPKGKNKDKGGSPEQATNSPQNELALQVAFVYDPTGKRDPFKPFDFAPKNTNPQGQTPLERYDYGQLRLTAVLGGMGEPYAIVENQAGRGFTAKKGTKIGIHGGEIVEILPDKILILETTVDFTGVKKSRTHELKLRTKDQENKLNEFNQ
jgi:Tfp pilus assembly protein PilP